MGKRLKELCRSRLAQFLTVQSMIAMEIVQFAFCSDAGTAYASVRRELYVPLRRFANMGISIALVVGITSLILYVSSSNEKNAEKGKSWALRSLGAIVLFMVLKSPLGVGILDKFVNEFL